jgi:AAA15 family ATPase/GTPase
MIKNIVIKHFKSIEEINIELGRVNIFIGANGSGKSNILEAIGVLSAAAFGIVDDESLLRRGVRPGVPRLYKCAFQFTQQKQSPHIFFSASNEIISYEVSIHNPIEDPKPAWHYKTESLKYQVDNKPEKINRSQMKNNKKYNPERGLVASKLVDNSINKEAMDFIDLLIKYAIYSPNTPTLRGITQELQPRDPIGLSGGLLPQAIESLLKSSDEFIINAINEVNNLIDWAKYFDVVSSNTMLLSPSASTSKNVIRFTDKYMKKNRNTLSGYDASEGALYILFNTILSLDEKSPKFLAIDNADHGLNPRLARALIENICKWVLNREKEKQILLTTHNPLVLDGIPLQNDDVHLYTVSRSNTGRTELNRVIINDKIRKMADQGWTLSRLWVMGHLGGVPNV